MAEFYAKDKNLKTGSIEFSGQKVAKVVFDEPFKKFPSIGLTLEDGGSSYMVHASKVKKTDFRIVFKTPYSKTVAWTATEK